MLSAIAILSSLSWTSASSGIVLITRYCGRSQVQRNNTNTATLSGFQMVFVSCCDLALYSVDSSHCFPLPEPIPFHTCHCLSPLSDTCLLSLVSLQALQKVWNRCELLSKQRYEQLRLCMEERKGRQVGGEGIPKNLNCKAMFVLHILCVQTSISFSESLTHTLSQVHFICR